MEKERKGKKEGEGEEGQDNYASNLTLEIDFSSVEPLQKNPSLENTLYVVLQRNQVSYGQVLMHRNFEIISMYLL